MPVGIDLPAQRVPFAVESDYRIRPDLRRLGPGERRFVRDTSWKSYLYRKLELLESHPQQCRVLAHDRDALLPPLWRVARLLAQEDPKRYRLDDDGLTVTPVGIRISRDGRTSESIADDEELQGRIGLHLCALPPVERLADLLALSVQEDLVLVAGPAGSDRASLLHVCFPSHWNPAEHREASFAELHAPVPHNEGLLGSSRNMLTAMLTKGPFVRFVWSLTGTPHLDQNPARPHPARHFDSAVHSGTDSGSSLIDRLYFRAERQTTTALDGFALFTIRIYVAPLREVLMVDGERARRLAQAIRSMDARLLRYKGLADMREPLLESLESFDAGG